VLVAESVYGGTWASGTLPPELVDFELMHEMRWSWDELQATPAYVRRFTWDMIQARREAESAQIERAKAGHGD
jgi:hypothetical protein